MPGTHPGSGTAVEGVGLKLGLGGRVKPDKRRRKRASQAEETDYRTKMSTACSRPREPQETGLLKVPEKGGMFEGMLRKLSPTATCETT